MDLLATGSIHFDRHTALQQNEIAEGARPALSGRFGPTPFLRPCTRAGNDDRRPEGRLL
jgi:hypothetical protein